MMRWNHRRPGLITIAAAAVAIGLLPLPSEYYWLLHLLLCGISLYFLTRQYGVRDREKWVLVGLVVLYNPIAPIPLGDQLLWSIINIATVAWFSRLHRRPGVSY